MKTFAIDPGPHTGIFYDHEEFGFCSLTLDYTDKLVERPHENLYYWLMKMVNPDTDRVVLESFEFRKDDAQNREYIDYSPGEFVGVVKLYCQLTRTPLYMQSASQAKGGFWGDDKQGNAKIDKITKLESFKWKTRHEKDAMRHWLYHQTFTIGDQQWLMKLK